MVSGPAAAANHTLKLGWVARRAAANASSESPALARDQCMFGACRY